MDDVDALLVYYRSTLTDIEYDLMNIIFQEEKNSKEKNRKLINILKTRGGMAFQNFIMALKETNQHDLAKLFDANNESLPTYEENIKSAKDEKFNASQLDAKLKL